MNVWLTLLLLVVAYLLFDAGYVFFALVIGVVLLLVLIAGLFSAKAGKEKPEAKKEAPAEEEIGPYATKGRTPWEKVFMAVGAVFNFVGKTIYRLLRFGKRPWD